MKKIVVIILLAISIGTVQAATIEVSQPRQITAHSYYERNPSAFMDSDGTYWLFYSRADALTERSGTNVNNESYMIYYQTSSDKGNNWSSPILLDKQRPASFNQQEIYACEDSMGKIRVFAGSGNSGESRGIFFYTSDNQGESWSDAQAVVIPGQGEIGHFHMIRAANQFRMVYQTPDVNGIKLSSSSDGTTWSQPVDIYAGGMSMPRISSTNGILYVTTVEGDAGKIWLAISHDSGAIWTTRSLFGSDEPGGDRDPFIAHLPDGRLMIVWAPMVSGLSDAYHLEISLSSDLGDTWSEPRVITAGHYGESVWWDYAPALLIDGQEISFFYASERDVTGTSNDTGNIWMFNVTWDIGNHHYEKIQAAIDAAAPNDSIMVAPGRYDERIIIDKPLTLLGATYAVNKNGYPVPEGYAWDDAVESIIQNPDPPLTVSEVVKIQNTSNVVFKGFIVQSLNALENSKNDHLLTIAATTQTMDSIIIENNVIGPNTHITAQDGTHGRMGLYINVNRDNFGLTNSSIAHNKIFNSEGNGNNIFIWASYYAYGPTDTSPMTGTRIYDNEIYGSHRTGIETAGGYSDLTIEQNTIYGNSGLPGDDPDMLKYGHGILLDRGSSDKMADAQSAFGPSNLTIKHNEIYNNQKSGIYIGPINHDYTIEANRIHDNGWNGIMLDLDGNFYNPTFEVPPTSGDYAVYDGSENIVARFNEFYNNGDGDDYGIRVVSSQETNVFIDAANNWWGDASGPVHHANADGQGEAVSDAVVYTPWLTAPLTHPGQPDIISPAYGQENVERPFVLEGSDYFDYQNKSHLTSQWQIALQDGTIIFDSGERTHLRSISVPKHFLKINTSYFARVRYKNEAGWSSWSDNSLFTTIATDQNDSNDDGVPDDQAPMNKDIDQDGIPDAAQDNIKGVRNQVTGEDVGIKVAAGIIESASSISPDTIEKLSDHHKFDYGLFSCRIAGLASGSVVEVTFILPDNFYGKWYKYDELNGWQDYMDHIVRYEGKRVTIELKDGGFGDADGIANGVIIDPSGPAISPGPSNKTGCFIRTLLE